MVIVNWAERKSPVLSHASLACLAHIPSVNLTSGCAHNCVYCYTRGYSSFPGNNKIIIYQNVLDKLKTELLHKRTKPKAIYFSPSSDIFQPVPELLELTHDILKFLLSKNIGIAFLTKGKIPTETLDLLSHHADMVRVQIGIISHDDSVRSTFEPNAASIPTRLQQITTLIAKDIAVEARLVPILPGITDQTDAIDYICAALASTGVKKAAISTLFLRPAIISSFRQHIADNNTVNNLLSYYKDARRLSIQAAHSSIISLSRQRRKEIYANYRHIAGSYGIDLAICGCMNPDIGGTCNISGKWPSFNVPARLF